MLRLSPCKYIVAVLVFAGFFALSAAAVPAQQGSEAQASQQAADPADIGGRLTAFVSEQMAEAAEQLSGAARGLAEIPGLAKDLLVMAQDPENLFACAAAGLKIVLSLFAGFIAAWVLRRLLMRARLALGDREGDRDWVRILLALGRTLMDILPIAGFVIAAYAVVPFTDPGPEIRLMAVSLVAAVAVSRFVLVVARLICLPEGSGRAFLFADREAGRYCYIWIRRMTILWVYGYFILEAALLTGMPGALHSFLIKFLGFAVMVLLVSVILQNKQEVAAWIGRPRGAPGQKKATAARPFAGRAFLRRLADAWHIIAILVVAGFYITWALEIPGGNRFLLAGFLKTLVVIFLAAMFVRLLRHGIARLFCISDSLKQDYPGLEQRANRYQPFVLGALSGVIYLIAAFAVLEAWGLGTLGFLFSPMGGAFAAELGVLLLIIAGAVVLWEFVYLRIERSLSREDGDAVANRRKFTLLPLLKNVVLIILIVITAMLVLSRLGINIGPLLAGAGVLGLAVGFGAQTLVRDMITGAFILLEDALAVGDWVEAGGHSGTVERLTVRTVTLRDLGGTVHLIPFSEVTTVTNYNRDYAYALIDAGVAYRERYGDVVQALQDTAAELKSDETWRQHITGELEVFGMNNLGDSAVEIRVRLKTRPMQQFAVKRAFLERMKRIFDERGIEIPFPHRTIWFGVEKDGTAPPMRLAMDKTGSLSSAPGPESEPEPEVTPQIQVASEKQASEGVVEEAEADDHDDPKK